MNTRSKIAFIGLVLVVMGQIPFASDVWSFIDENDVGVSPTQQKSDKQERVRLVHADSLVNVFNDGKEVTELFGHVRLVQGEAYLECLQAKLWHDENRALLTGEVNIYDGKRTLTGDRVEYDGKNRTEEAVGRVLLRSGDRRLTAGRLLYSQETEVADAADEVVIAALVEKATVQGDTAVYDRKRDYGIVRGNPMLTRQDSVSGDTMVVRGLTIEAWGDDQRAVVTDSVRIEKGDLSAVCQRAEYRSKGDSLILEKLPVVWHRGHEMRGERIDILLDGIRFQGGIIQGRAEVVSTDSLARDVLKGREIHVEVRRDTIRRVVVDGQASSLYHVFEEDRKGRTEQGMNTVTGDRIELFFDGDRLDRVVVKSDPAKCSGTYKPDEVRRKTVEKGEGL